MRRLMLLVMYVVDVGVIVICVVAGDVVVDYDIGIIVSECGYRSVLSQYDDGDGDIDDGVGVDTNVVGYCGVDHAVYGGAHDSCWYWC